MPLLGGIRPKAKISGQNLETKELSRQKLVSPPDLFTRLVSNSKKVLTFFVVIFLVLCFLIYKSTIGTDARFVFGISTVTSLTIACIFSHILFPKLKIWIGTALGGLVCIIMAYKISSLEEIAKNTQDALAKKFGIELKSGTNIDSIIIKKSDSIANVRIEPMRSRLDSLIRAQSNKNKVKTKGKNG